MDQKLKTEAKIEPKVDPKLLGKRGQDESGKIKNDFF